MVLNKNCEDFVENLRINLVKFDMDPLSNLYAYHITGTIGQADVDLWHLIRLFRVTASNFKVSNL